MKEIPLIDISPIDSPEESDRLNLAQLIKKACERIGFLYVTGHGVAAEKISAMRQIMRHFFALEDYQKRRFLIQPGNYRGYIPMAAFSPNSGIGVPDLYEGYKLHLEIQVDDPITNDCELYGPNRWPDQVPEFEQAVLTYWQEMDNLSQKLLRAFALALNLDESYFLPYFDKPLTNMTLLHYPSMPKRNEGFGIHPHKDSDAFTILYPDPVGGLEIETLDGNWIAVTPPEGTFIVNIGDMMELWSGGHFRSTPHKVVNRTGKERYSFPYFATPRYDTIIEPIVTPKPGFNRPALDVGYLSAEVFRTNWEKEKPKDTALDLGTLMD